MNCIQPIAPAEEVLRLVPKAVSISLIPARIAGALRAEPVGVGGALVDRDQDRRHAASRAARAGERGDREESAGRRWRAAVSASGRLRLPASDRSSAGFAVVGPALTPPLGGGVLRRRRRRRCQRVAAARLRRCSLGVGGVREASAPAVGARRASAGARPRGRRRRGTASAAVAAAIATTAMILPSRSISRARP